MDNFNFRQEAEKARSAELPGQGYSPMDNPTNQGYDVAPEAKIAMAQSFGDAFRIARRTLGNDAIFEYKGKKFSTKLKEEVEKEHIEKVASAQHDYISKGQATIHDELKGVYDIKQLLENTRPAVSLMRPSVNDMPIGEPGIPQFGAMKNIFNKM